MSALLRFPRIGFVMCYLRHQCPSSRTFHGLRPVIKTVGRWESTGHVTKQRSRARGGSASSASIFGSAICPPWLSLQPIEPRLRQLGQAAVDNQWSPAKQTGEEYKGNQPGTEMTIQESITPLLHVSFDFPLAITEYHGFRSHC